MLPNTIGTTAALLADGSVVSYQDSDPTHIRQSRFQEILDGKPRAFSVSTVDGYNFTVDLESGALVAHDRVFTPQPIGTPLRLIYYKHMYSDVDGCTPVSVCEYFVVGWQTTKEDGKNYKVGIKVWPKTKRVDITEDI